MKILIINEFGHNEVKNVNHIPQVGTKIDWDYSNKPTVTGVLNYPSLATAQKLFSDFLPALDAIVTVE